MDPKSKKRKKKKKNKKKPGTSLLSFGGDDEEEEFILKKKKKRSSQEQELTRARKRARAKQKIRQEQAKSGGVSSMAQRAALGPRTIGASPNEGLYSHLRSSAGMYTPDQLSALKSNAIHSRGGPTAKTDDTVSEQPPPVDEKAQQGALINQSDEVSLREERRDQAMVQAAREKRQRLRKIGGDYISLRKDREDGGLTTTIGGREYRMSTDEEHGALMGEDGEDDVEDYIQGHSGRMKFGEGADTRRKAIGSLVSRSKRKTGKGIHSLLSKGDQMDMDDDQDDEEDDGFLDSLIRSGGGSLQASRHTDLMVKRRRDRDAAAASSGSSVSASVAARPSEPPPRLTVADIKSAIAQSLTGLREDTKRKERQLDKIRVSMQSASGSVTDIQDSLEKLNQKYLFFQSTRDQFATLMDCLKEKSTMIDGAWTELEDLRAKYTKFMAESRALHVQDEVVHAWGPAPPSSPKLDSFGRDLNYEAVQGRDRRAKEREACRAAIAAQSAEPEGWEVRDVDTSAGVSLDRELKALLADAALIFQDVVPSYATLDFARDKMQFMKEQYSQLYEDAYIALSGPSVFAPYIRLELLRWNPLRTPHLDGMDWYGKLFDFGFVEGQPDDNVIPRVVEKLVVPLLVNLFATCWDVYDTTNTATAIDSFKEISAHLMDDSPGFGHLRTAVVQRLTLELKQHAKTPVIPTQTPHRCQPAATEEEAKQREERKLSFCRRQWWRGLKFFTQVCRWLEVDAEMDADIIDILYSFFRNSLMPLLQFQVQCITVAGSEKADASLVQSVSLMSQRLAAYLPALSAKIPGAPSAALAQLCTLLTAYTQLTASSAEQDAHSHLKQGIALSKLLVQLRNIAMS